MRVYSRHLNLLQECAKLRGVYAASALATLSKKLEHDAAWATEQLQAACDDDSVYTCGAHPFPSSHSLAQHMYCNDTLTCASLVEGALYTSNATTLNKIANVFDVTRCIECGVQQLSKERCDEIGCASGQVSQWKHWPLCRACDEEGRSLTVRKRARATRASAMKAVVRKSASLVQHNTATGWALLRRLTRQTTRPVRLQGTLVLPQSYSLIVRGAQAIRGSLAKSSLGVVTVAVRKMERSARRRCNREAIGCWTAAAAMTVRAQREAEVKTVGAREHLTCATAGLSALHAATSVLSSLTTLIETVVITCKLLLGHELILVASTT